MKAKSLLRERMDQRPKKMKNYQRPSRADLVARQRKAAARLDRRKKIMDAAARLFCEKGFADTTVDQIAAGAELTKPSLYASFGGEGNFKGKYDKKIRGKREILLTCLDDAVDACKNAIFEVEKDTSARGKHLRFAVERYADIAFRERGMRLLLAIGTKRLSAKQREIFADVNDRFKSLLVGSMPVGTASPESFSEMFVSLVQGLAMLQLPIKTKQNILSILLDLVVSGSSGARFER
jgi:AcrR family transcriptional regulator